MFKSVFRRAIKYNLGLNFDENERQDGFLVRALEPRIVLDAAAVSTFMEMEHDEAESNGEGIDIADLAPLNAEHQEMLGNEVAFIDSGVDNLSEVLASINPHIDVVVLSDDSDGVQQIDNYLNGKNDIDAIHIIAHGGSGFLQLGSSYLSSDTTYGSHNENLLNIGASLADDGDILIYGCNFGEGAGLTVAEQLAQITGADIAASDDLTGAESLGGDWDLEIHVGEIETRSLEAQAFKSVLAGIAQDTPSAETGAENVSVVFSTANGNAPTLTNNVGTTATVTLASTNGTLSLASTSGLNFTTGDGTNDATLTFEGSIANLNAALDGLTFNPNADFTGDAEIQMDSVAGVEDIHLATNHGFESPDTPSVSIRYIDAADVPGWDTTDVQGKIEVWNNAGGFTAYEGEQFIEINAFSAGTLSQTVSRNAGDPLEYSFAHRGRQGVDTVHAQLTDLGADGTLGTADDVVLLSKNFSTDKTAWRLYKEDLGIASGNDILIEMTAVSSASGNNSKGNFLDAVDLSFSDPVTTVSSKIALNIQSDADGDGVIDIDDIDDDNDGIIDVNEGYNTVVDKADENKFLTLSDDGGADEVQGEFISGGYESAPADQVWTFAYDDVRGAESVQNGNDSAFKVRLFGNTAKDSQASVDNNAHFVLDLADPSQTTTNEEVLSNSVEISDLGATNSTFTVKLTDMNGNALTLGEDFEAIIDTGKASNPATFSEPVDLGNGVYQFSYTAAALNPNPAIQFSTLNGTLIKAAEVTVIDHDANGENILVSSSREIAKPTDSDGDGVFDHLDLDSDNDGITDNVEAQTTAGYIKPIGADVDGDGLDDAYDQNTSSVDPSLSVGSIPVDTDSDGTADVLDADSDNDGKDDVAERSDGGPTSVTSTTDTDGDGLLDIFEGSNVNDGYNVNDENLDVADANFLLGDDDDDVSADGKDAVAIVSDLDFRDNHTLAVADADGDGVIDIDDIDDDNDGITDVNEGMVLQNEGIVGPDPFSNNPTSDFVPKSGSMTGGAYEGAPSSEEWTSTFTNIRTLEKLDNQDFLRFAAIDNSTFSLDLGNPEATSDNKDIVHSNVFMLSDIDQPTTMQIRILDDDGVAADGADFLITETGGTGTISGPVDLGNGYYEIEISGTINDFNLDIGLKDNAISSRLDIIFTQAGSGDLIGITSERVVETGVDNDNDGVFDHLDLDSDNDGITDNVEGQSTASYIKPVGADIDGDGLDDAYDADNGSSDVTSSIGLIQADTDGDGTVDRLDADSDNDGKDDIVERGDGAATSITDMSDSDGDGLLDIFEGGNVNDGYDVNDENLDAADVNFNLDKKSTVNNDGSNATALTNDFKFRDKGSFPVAVNDHVIVTEDTAVNGSVLANDTDDDGDPLTLTQAMVDVNGDGVMDNLPLGVATPLTNSDGDAIGTLTVNGDGSYDFAPAANYHGPVPNVDYTVSDGILTDIGTLSFSDVIAVDDAPVAVDDMVAVSEDTPVSGSLLANDSDVDGDPLTVTQAMVDVNGDGTATAIPLGMATSLSNSNGDPIGSLIVNGDGSYEFTPSPDYTGPVPALTYDVSDGTLSDTGQLTLGPVSAVDDAPVTVDDVVMVTEDTPVSGNLLANDSDVDGDPLTVTQAMVDVNGDGVMDNLPLGVATPLTNSDGDAIGTLTVNDDGSYDFAPAANYHGPVPNVDYTGSDGQLTDTGTLALGTVVAVDDAPVAVDDMVAVSEDTPVSGSLLVNDSDVDGDPLTVTQAMVDVNGDGTATAIPLGMATSLSNSNGDPIGSLIVNGDGSYEFTPSPDYTGPVPALTYDVSDGTLSDTGQLTLGPVSAVDDAPVTVDDVVVVTEDTPVSGNLLANDTDVDGDPLTVTQAMVDVNGDGVMDNLPLGVATPLTNSDGDAIGTLTVNDDGSYDFAPAANYHGPVPNVTYTGSDGQLTDTGTLALGTVVAVDDAPVAVDDMVAVSEDVPVNGSLLDNDSDADGDILTITDAMVDVNGDGTLNPLTLGSATLLTNNDGDLIGTIRVSGDGSYEFNPIANYHGPVPDVSYTVSDGQLTDTGMLTLGTIAAVDDAPIAAPDHVAVAEDVTVSGSVLNNDTDADDDPLIVTEAMVDVNGDGIETPLILGQATSLTGSDGQAIGQVTLNSDGSYQFVPGFHYTGEVPPVTYTVSDGTLTDASVLSFGPIGAVDDPPVAVDDVIAIVEDTPVSGSLLSNDEDPDGDALTITEALVDVNGDGTATAISLGHSTILSDANGDLMGTLMVNTDGTYEFIPAADYIGTLPDITYTVSDGILDDTGTASLGPISPVDDAPIVVDDVAVVTEDTPVTGSLTANDTDADGDPLTVTSAAVDANGDGNADDLTLGVPTPLTDSNGDAIGSLTVNDDGSYAFTPAPNYTGPVPDVAYTVSDGLLTDSGQLSLGDVVAVDDAPVAEDDTIAVVEDTPVTGSVLSNDTDVDGDILTITQAMVDANGDGVATPLTLGVTTPLSNSDGDAIGTMLLNGDGSFTFVPAPDYAGPVPAITYTASDGLLTDTAVLDLGTVAAVDDAPVTSDDVAVVTEDTPVTGSLTANDTDADGDPLTVTSAAVDANGDGNADDLTLGVATPLTDSNGDAIGSLTVNDDGSYAFTPAPNYTGPVPDVAYTVSDGLLTDSGQLSLGDVVAVDDAPVAEDDTIAVVEDTPVTGSVLSNDTDVDGDILTITQAMVDANGDGVATPLTLGVTTPLSNSDGDAIGTMLLNGDGSFTFVPAPDYAGPVPAITYTASDGLLTDTAVLDLGTVAAVDDAPVTSDDVAVVTEDTPVMGSLTANDTDADGDPLTVTSAAVDANGDGNADDLTLGVATPLTDSNGDAIGSLTVNDDGSYAFAPAPNYTGPVPDVAYTVSDGLLTDSGQLSLGDVVAVDDAPVAEDDTIAVVEDTPVTGSVLSNDTDVDGDILTITQAMVDANGDGVATPLTLGVTTPLSNSDGDAIGTMLLNGDGSFTFVPAPDYAGPVPAITYTASDGLLTDTAVLDLGTVAAVDDAPVTSDDVAVVTEDTPVTGSLTANDTDADGDPLTVTSAAVDANGDGNADDLTLGVPTPLTDSNGDAIGSLTVNDDGSYAFTPAPNYTGPVPDVAYTVSDGLLTDSGQLSLGDVVAVDDAPVAEDDTIAVVEDTPVTGSVLSNDTDVDGDILTITQAMVDANGDGVATPLTLGVTTPLSNSDGDAIGTMLLNGDGSFTFVPAPDYAGPVPAITYTASDGLLTDTAVLDLGTVAAVDDAPVTSDDVAVVTEDTPVTGSLTANDTDADGDPLTVTSAAVDANGDGNADDLTLGVATPLTDSNGDAIGSLTVNDDGSYAFTPAPNYTGPVPDVAYTVSDGLLTDSGQLSLGDVVAVDDAPVAEDDTIAVVEDTPVTGSVLSNDTDVDGDILTITQAMVDANGDGVATPLTLGVTTPLSNSDGDAIGTMLLNGDGSFTFVPAPDYAGPVPAITYTASDGLLTDTAVLDLGTVAAVDDAPVTSDDVAVVTEDTPVTGSLTANDTDADGDPLTVTSAAVDANGDGNADDLTLGVATPLTDSNGDAIGSLTVNDDGSYAFTPAPNYTGPVPDVAYTVSDGLLTDSGQLSLGDVVAVDDAPVAEDDTIAVVEDTPVTGSVLSNDTDVDGDILTITQAMVDANGDGVATPLTLGVTTPLSNSDGDAIGTMLLNGDGSFTFVPAPDYAGPVPAITYTASDGLLTDTAVLDLGTVAAVDDAPVTSDDVAVVTEDTPVMGSLTANDTDADGDPLTVTSAAVDANGDGNADDLTLGVATPLTDSNGDAIGSLTVNDDGSYAFTPAPNYTGPVPDVAYTVSDGLLTDSGQLSLGDVVAVDDAPVAEDDTIAVVEDTPVTGSVLSNDTDVDGDILTLSDVQVDINGDGVLDTLALGVSTPLINRNGTPIGTLTMNENGVYEFAPAADYNGTVPDITYTVSDGFLTDTGTASLGPVLAVNDAPTARADQPVVQENTPVHGVVDFSDIDGDALTITADPQHSPQYGRVVVHADGRYVFTPNPGFHGKDSFKIFVDDGTSRVTVTIDVVVLEKLSFVPDSSHIPVSYQLESFAPKLLAQLAKGMVLDTADQLDTTNNKPNNTANKLGFSRDTQSNVSSKDVNVTNFNNVLNFNNWQGSSDIGRALDFSAGLSIGDAAYGHLNVDTVMSKNTLFIDSRVESNGKLQKDTISYEMKRADGTPMPRWIKEAKPGFYMVDVPLDAGVEKVIFSAVDQAGTVYEKTFNLNFATGHLQEIVSETQSSENNNSIEAQVNKAANDVANYERILFRGGGR